LVADGCRIPAHAWEQSHDTLQLLIDDPSGLLMGRLFVAQLVQAVSGRRRILGTIRHVYTRSSEALCVVVKLAGMCPDGGDQLTDDDEIVVCL
jgi:hypothetical protein